VGRPGGAGPPQLVRVRPRRGAAAPLRPGRAARPDRGNLLVELDDGTLAGDVSYFAVFHGPNPGSRAFNVGIALLPEHRGRGHGAEAQRQLAAYLFAHTRVERLEASTDVENLAEQRALERAGFAREGILRHAQFRDGGFHDLVLYSRLRGDRPSQV
jgi:RimJ/RimL family protein N-acetyltransferase